MTELLFVLLIAASTSTLITGLSHFIKPYENGLTINLFYNALIFLVGNIIYITFIEALLSYLENKKTKEITGILENKLSEVRFQVLKNQINPHFMFNSLNVLSVLIENDRNKAQRFIEEFSKMYRYVLETIEQPLVLVKEELEFLRSFMFLQKIRHGDSLIFNIDLPSEQLEKLIPPFAFQIVAENACKHNVISTEQPLTIELVSDQDNIIIKNTFQPKQSGAKSAKIGQKNLIVRYKLISNQQPKFRVTQGYYKAILPLINEKKDERSDN